MIPAACLSLQSTHTHTKRTHTHICLRMLTAQLKTIPHNVDGGGYKIHNTCVRMRRGPVHIEYIMVALNRITYRSFHGCENRKLTEL